MMRSNPAEDAIDLAVQRVYETYGPDLSVFFEAVRKQQQLETERERTMSTMTAELKAYRHLAPTEIARVRTLVFEECQRMLEELGKSACTCVRNQPAPHPLQRYIEPETLGPDDHVWTCPTLVFERAARAVYLKSQP